MFGRRFPTINFKMTKVTKMTKVMEFYHFKKGWSEARHLF